MKIMINIKLKNFLYLGTVLLVLLYSCHKNDSIIEVQPDLPEKSVSVYRYNFMDTLSYKVSVAKDSIVTLRFWAVVSEKITAGKHDVKFRVDETKMSIYQTKYGAGTLLPAENYFAYDDVAKLSSDSLKSTALRFNVINTSKLLPQTKYVLPVVIESVDGKKLAVNPFDNTLFLIVNTGKSPIINRADWEIVDYSSAEDPYFSPESTIDDDPDNFWMSSMSATLPQYFTVDMKQTYQLASVFYTNLGVSYGGYPLKVNIKTSLNGTTWKDLGDFTCRAVATETIDFAVTPARYFRFTVLDVQLYSGMPTILLSEVGATFSE